MAEVKDGRKTRTFGKSTITILADGTILLADGQRLPKGSRYNGNKQTIDLPDGDHLGFYNGRVIRNTPRSKGDGVDKLKGTTYWQNEYTGPSQKVSNGNGYDSTNKRQAINNPDRPREPGRNTGGDRGAAGRAPAAAPRPPAVPTTGSGGGGRSTPPAAVPTPPVAAPKPPAAPVAAAPRGGTASPAAPPVAPATSARPGSTPVAPAPAAAAPKPVTPKTADVDKMVRQMFGEVAAFLSDKELGPLLRKAATEGWDNTRLMGALQQTKFWKTKGDVERKWIILNKLDNATAKTQVQAQMQAITDLTRSEGVQLSGLQIHDLAVNVLKYGYSGPQVREQVYKLVPQRGITTAVTTQYGYLAAFLSHPEVGPLLDRGAREGWTAQRLEAELQKTNWWKTTTETQRRFNAAQVQDPASAEQAVTQQASRLQTVAAGLGVRLSPERTRQIATDSLRFGWDDTQVRQALAAEYDYEGSEFGQAGQTARQFRQMAGDYLVPMSEQTMSKWVEDVVSGRVDEEGFRSYLTEQAKSMFPSLSGAIDRGITVRQYADPYVQIAARELELSPEQVDLNNGKYRAMLDQIDPKTGERTSMTLSQAQTYLRKQPEWQKTRGANEQAASLTENILRTFGAVA